MSMNRNDHTELHDVTAGQQNQSNYGAKPQVSLTAPNRDHFEQVSLTVFWMQLPQLKN